MYRTSPPRSPSATAMAFRTLAHEHDLRPRFDVSRCCSFGALRHRVLVLPARFPSRFSLARADLGTTDNSW